MLKTGLFSEAVSFAISQYIKQNVHTMIPGEIVEYDSASKRARIQPSINRVFSDGQPPLPRAPLVDVPVVSSATGGYMVHQQIDVGDNMMVIFSERGLDDFKERWSMSNPTPGKYFSDAVAIRWGVEDIIPYSDKGIVIQDRDGKSLIKLSNDIIELRVGNSRLKIDGSGIKLSAKRIDLN